MSACPLCRSEHSTEAPCALADFAVTRTDVGAEPVLSGATSRLPIGTTIGEYRITDHIGQGGMGVVYGGVQPLIGKQVAIKVLRLEHALRPDIVGRFVSEARAVNAIGSRHIIDIFSFGQLPDGRYYHVMDRLRGRSLREYLRTLEPRSFERVAPLMEDVLRGLSAAHAAGIVHRDLKPDNIFVAEEPSAPPSAVLLDFGIAKLLTPSDLSAPSTGTTEVFGTPQYMAPEQFRGSKVDARTDLYAVGVILFEALTGRLPFQASSFVDLANQHLDAPPPRPSRLVEMARPLEELILRLLAKLPSDRPASADTVLRELSALRVPATTGTLRRAAWPYWAAAVAAAGLGLAAVRLARRPSSPTAGAPLVNSTAPAPVHAANAAPHSVDVRPAAAAPPVSTAPPAPAPVERAAPEMRRPASRTASSKAARKDPIRPAPIAADDRATLNPFGALR